MHVFNPELELITSMERSFLRLIELRSKAPNGTENLKGHARTVAQWSIST